MSIHDVLKLLGGVALLIYGIKIMGDALQDLAGDRMRKLISSLTSTPLKGVAAGAVVTMIIQSSSATTVMVVSFVHVGLMTLSEGFSVIMGANIGTTIIAQLIAFNISQYSIITAVFGALLTIAGKNERQKQMGTGLIGFALLFIGMEMMQDAMNFLQGRRELFAVANNFPIVGLAVGALVTAAVQASSATVGLTMVMAAQGLLDLRSAVAIIFGDNIGTTITAVIASWGGNRSAKQAAAAHVMFNVLGSVIMMIFLGPFSRLVELTSSDIARQVANSHSLFNIINTCIFLPFITPYTNLIRRIIKDDQHGAVLTEQGARFLDENLIDISPAAGVDAVRKEMVRLGGIALNMLRDCYKLIVEDEIKLMPEAMMTEKTINQLTHEIVRYATELGPRVRSADLSLLLNSCISGVGDFERMGDHSENLVEMAQFMLDRKQKFSAKALMECQEMFDLVIEAVEKCIRALEDEDISMAEDVLVLEPKIDQMERVLRARHIERLNSGKCSPDSGVVFIDILSNLERVGDHARNVAYIVNDIKRINRGQVSR
ncbi:MAG: Na/Pi cotransporter family protein [Synergistaceae bacterium]|nr:Na/Pi cotransporter family protein [Synergistaceae bacterium]